MGVQEVGERVADKGHGALEPQRLGVERRAHLGLLGQAAPQRAQHLRAQGLAKRGAKECGKARDIR